MNFLKSLKNKKGMSGAIKASIVFLTLAFIVVSVSYIIPAFAVHSSGANVIIPGFEKCNVFNTYTLTVTQTGGPDPIYNVRIYNKTNNVSTSFLDQTGFACGPAPTGWSFKGFFNFITSSYCEYETDQDPANPYTIATGGALNFTFSINILNESVHTFQVSTIDTQQPVGFQFFSYPTITVDCTPPVTTKTYGQPFYSPDNNATEWINSSTLVKLTAIDPQPHPSNVSKTYYKDVYLSDSTDWHYCSSSSDCANYKVAAPSDPLNPDGWTLYSSPFTKSPESCHIIEYYSVDNVGNVEPIKHQCVFVDNTQPTLTKIIGSPNKTCDRSDSSGCAYWVTQSTPIELNCTDQGDHPVNHVSIWYKIWNDKNNTWSPWIDTAVLPQASKTIYFGEDSVHILEAYCVDAVGNAGPIDNETFRVDSTPPVITKTVIGPQVGTCPPRPGHPEDNCYIKDSTDDDGTIIQVNATDPDSTGKGCNVGQVKCEYYYLLDNGSKKMSFHDDTYSPFNITFNDDSNHTLVIKCWDSLGNIGWDNETFLVDSTPPTTTKTYGNPSVVNGNYRWINSSTPITLSSIDNKVGVDNIQYRVTKLNISDSACVEACEDYGGSGDYQGVKGNNVTFTIPEYSCHFIEYWAVDKLGNAEKRHYQCVFVDNQAPQMLKTVGQPNIPVAGTGCENVTYDGAVPSGSGATIDPDHLGSKEEPIVLKPGDSINESKIITTSATPIGKLDVVFLFDLTGSMGGVIGSAQANAISIMNNITSLVNDSQFGVGSFRDYPSESSDQYSSCGYPGYYGDPGDSPWYFNQDLTNNTAAVSTAISGFFANGGGDGPEAYARALYESSQDFSWRAGARKVVIIFGDNVPHDCNLGTYYDGSGSCPTTTGRDPGRDGIVNTSDDLPWPTVVSDLQAAGVSVVFVDLSSGYACPGAWKYATNQTGGIYTLGSTSGLPAQIVSSVQNITGEIKHLTLETKPGFEDWVKWTPTEYTDVKGGEIKDFNITITVPSGQPGGNYHFYIKVMGDGAILAVEEIFVHVDAPACAGGESFTWVRDDVTPITLSCDDSWNGTAPHPVDQETMCYKISFDKPETPWLTGQYCGEFGGDYNSTTGECCAYVGKPIIDDAVDSILPKAYTFTFMEDSNHDLEFYCKDALGNKGTLDVENFKVDSTPPIITKTLVGPHIGCGPSDTSCYIKDWNNSDGTTIHVEVADNNSLGCAVGGVKCEYYYLLDDNATKKGFVDDSAPPFDIKFNDDSNHTLVIKCWDALKNSVTDTESFLVDSIPPVTKKTYGTPFYTDGTSDWITSATPISLTSTDNKVGVDKTYYKYEIVDDSNCYNDTLCQGLPDIDKTWDSATPSILGVVSFTIPEDSCHLIEFYSADKLGNVETPKRQCVFVDNQPPTVSKIISDPKEHWEGDNTFYPGLTERCWNDSAKDEIECWKITLGTTLNISCNDPQPHPVDNSKMCFQVELDGDDKTQTYCGSKYIDGNFNESGDGYCCLSAGENMENFQFAEESQHDLKVKCVDALGNQGPVDEEKFKVEGCTEQLCLYKKWNLISVPFVLFNDSTSDVFKNISDDIVSVWSYDNGNWYTWSPGVGGTLQHIKPGYGYWVLAKDDKCFDIAGSLFSPLEVPPSRDLQPGWNLVGYYGNTIVNKDGVFAVDPVDSSKCIIANKPVYCALNSLIDTEEGFPRWSSLWNYFNNGGDKAGWEGLSGCIDGKWTDNMEPYKGYWIEMDVKDSYAPATNCIWNTDLKCVSEFH